MNLIPAPLSFEGPAQPAAFGLAADTWLNAGPGAGSAGSWLRSTLGAATGFPLLPGAPDAPGIELALDPELAQEEYLLQVEPRLVRLTAGDAAGLFWGAQTLRQLLGPRAYRRAPLDREDWTVPCGTIRDRPRFGWRGLLLDVSRHFLPKAEVLRYLDLMAAHKLNVLHLHLTDDQGWRIEIKRYPRLTEVGGWRESSMVGFRGGLAKGLTGAAEAAQLTPDQLPLARRDGRPHGGFYTQDDLREIVAYAAARQITVVPEIDVPGHAQAAIAAYPELGNTDVQDTAALKPWTD